REQVPALWQQTAGNLDFTATNTSLVIGTSSSPIADVTDNFGNFKPLSRNEAATLGFWSNKGQALIKSSTFNGSALASYLKNTTTGQGNIFTTGGGDLFSGSTATDVANYFLTLKNSKKQIDNLRVQILAVDLDVWATTTGLGWSTAPGGSQ